MIMESANFDPSTNDKNVMLDSCLDILNLNLVFRVSFFKYWFIRLIKVAYLYKSYIAIELCFCIFSKVAFTKTQ